MVFDKTFTVATRPAASMALQTAALQSIQRVAGNAKTLKDLAETFLADFEASQGHGWHVIVGKDFAVDVRYRKGCAVILLHKSTSTKLVLYRATHTSATPKLSADVPATGAPGLKSTIMESDMAPSHEAALVRMCERLVGLNSTEDMVADLKAYLVQSYGNTWHVAVAANHDLCGAVHATPGTYCDLTLTKGKQCTRFVVFQSSGFDATVDLLTLLHRVALVVAMMAGVLFLFYKTSYRVECLDEAACSANEHRVAKSSEWWQFVTTLAVVALIGLASVLRMSRNTIRQKIKHV
ncbi:hypothetical protein SPRG_09335 [Saprolegnia parasitica CBS 223.65]|uniref:Dynein light chain n=1 Tax=Saprolegnia parasitica (strain CBS 223.65) TaxID=695850 RepID=A0A067C4E7_SAPPC|nr:hypothetical protein SPRG_09335 [Saprolegnia parasitica CBS 223.65]KDO25393.1 hypothetical protein SPRG_09335 [Saprolegnia parasitica CBS 223.65]|eukprot:XP_012203821.1 hypothetical protein SPRG_09335 [Saprolegnia parasitica CBS 223.65]